MKYTLRVEGHDYEVQVEEVDHRAFRVTVDGEEIDVELGGGEPEAEAALSGSPRARSRSGGAQGHDAASASPQAGSSGQNRVSSPPSAAAETGVAGKSVLAPMPGTLLRVFVSEGDQVSPGDVVAILEAMKMENELRAKAEGTVGRVAVGDGQNVSKGDLVVEVV